MIRLLLPGQAGKTVADVAQFGPGPGKDTRHAAGRTYGRGIQERKIALQQGKPAHDVVDDGNGAAALPQGRATERKTGRGRD